MADRGSARVLQRLCVGLEEVMAYRDRAPSGAPKAAKGLGADQEGLNAGS